MKRRTKRTRKKNVFQRKMEVTEKREKSHVERIVLIREIGWQI
jgi:hypothetical protein